MLWMLPGESRRRRREPAKGWSAVRETWTTVMWLWRDLKRARVLTWSMGMPSSWVEGRLGWVLREERERGEREWREVWRRWGFDGCIWRERKKGWVTDFIATDFGDRVINPLSLSPPAGEGRGWKGKQNSNTGTFW
ncbi:hypothetical protein RHMOL_Rhmol08G0242300 [Rhododendron molle]|uniref:Uncharacterized protein n=1 Tax=Rhododendron molle TaxID=49168 RepID=A0ACC0MRS9_RHOML|nr:hypothetical protein RHMOL_Rhmol08G0242300 [Rhododendron molle]